MGGRRRRARRGDRGHAGALAPLHGADPPFALLAARRSGLEERLLASIGGPGERVSFPELADRVLRSLAVHAGRRAAELDSSAEAVCEAGVEPLLTVAAAAVLRQVAAADLRDAFGGERPASGAEVLALLDARL